MPQRRDAEQLDRDAAEDHDLYGIDGAVHQVKKQGAAQRRERETSDAGGRGGNENGHEGIAAVRS